MSALGEDGAFGRVMIGAAVAGLVAGALAFVPSPFGVLDLFQTVPPLEIKAPPPLKLQPVPVIEFLRFSNTQATFQSRPPGRSCGGGGCRRIWRDCRPRTWRFVSIPPVGSDR